MKPRGPARGYTLVEMLVTMVIFSVVMTLISASFGRIVAHSSSLAKATENDIAGLIGLEVMRADLEIAGFGLPYSGTKGLNYVEATDADQFVTSCPGGCPQAKPSLYNDSPYLDAPTAYRVGHNVGFNGSDYLVLKGTGLGTSSVCRSWCYLTYSSARPSGVEPELKDGGKDRVIVLRPAVVSGRPTRILVTKGTDFTVPFQLPFSPEFAPREKTDSYLVYGVAPAPNNAGAKLSFPFNRSDYYINRNADKMAPYCNSGTGILYKTTIDHHGSRTRYPILDCAADMQVVLDLDTNGDGLVDYHPGPEDAVLTADVLRDELKGVRVFILAQVGRKDPSYQFPMQDAARAIVVGDPALPDETGRVWNDEDLKKSFGVDWRNYHWKVYTISVEPKNL